MFDTIREWLGFGSRDFVPSHAAAPGRFDGSEHGHTHGVIDPSIASTARGVWAIKWSFVILAITAGLQFAVVVLSGSVALLADMIHNVGDATTAIPLWIAFMLARREPSKTFTHGLGRAEDLAGILIVLIILFSAIVAGYEAISRLISPQPVTQLGWLAAAGLIGFIGNEVVAIFRIRVGREMNSAALIADGYHARTDGLTSLAVVLGAAGVYLGFPIADPLIGLLITIAIFGIVWQSARAVITRALDGVEPNVVDEIIHAASHARGVKQVKNAKARWLGHELHADITIDVDGVGSLAQANEIASEVESELRAHIPGLAVVNVQFDRPSAALRSHHSHHHAPEPIEVDCEMAQGVLAIIDTAAGERMQLKTARHHPGMLAVVKIERPHGIESLPLRAVAGEHDTFLSETAPEEPHEFKAKLMLYAPGQDSFLLPFAMVEPEGH